LNRQQKTQFIKSEAQRLGFLQCGIAKAEKLDEEAKHLEEWLKSGFHGEMKYMENHFDLRIDPSKLVPGAKSVISLLYNYYTDKKQQDKQAPKISRYAFGRDYHFVIKEKLNHLLDSLKEKFGDFNGRYFVDSAPVMERAWAVRSGSGWIGKNNNLLSKDHGSFFFLAEIILDVELEYDEPFKTDHCGTCTQCMDACPTQAIVAPQVVDSRKCISYLTIELRTEIPNEFAGKMNDWMFGCDICQDVCPWNRFSKNNREIQFEPSEELLNKTKNEWEEISYDIFKRLFKDSAVQRTKFSGLQRNIKFLYKRNN